MYYDPKDTMRKTPLKGLSENHQELISDIKDQGQLFFNSLDSMGQSRELSLAKTKLEETVMWAVKHITK